MAEEGEFGGFPCSRDLLQGFSGDEVEPEEEGDEEGEVELSLGLTLGLSRSSSISAFPPPERPEGAEEIQSLTRTSSLPVESEEEWRKRKELQSLKRLEAMRKRSERRARDLKAVAEEEKEKEKVEVDAAAVGPGKGKAVEAVVPRWGGPGMPGPAGSLGSQGSTSANVSEFNSRRSRGIEITGLNSSIKAKDTLVTPLEHASNEILPSPILTSSKDNHPAPRKRKRINTALLDGTKEMERRMRDEMPCVSTKGDGPNGKRIQGFLYKYRKGEEVRIVCVCHGSFLTPAEFVEHAGGSDLHHPLKHIVMQPNPSGLF